MGEYAEPSLPQQHTAQVSTYLKGQWNISSSNSTFKYFYTTCLACFASPCVFFSATQTSVGIDALVCSCSPPFTVGIVTDAAVDTGAITTAGANRGNN